MSLIPNPTFTLTFVFSVPKALLEDIENHQPPLASLVSLGQTMTNNASHEDSVAMEDQLAHIQADFESLQRKAQERKKILEDALKQVGERGKEEQRKEGGARGKWPRLIEVYAYMRKQH